MGIGVRIDLSDLGRGMAALSQGRLPVAAEYYEAERCATQPGPILPCPIPYPIEGVPGSGPPRWWVTNTAELALKAHGAGVLPQVWPYMWHAGIPGLQVGDELLPPIRTGNRRTGGGNPEHWWQRVERVYLALHPAMAVFYGLVYSGGGALYRVATPRNVEPDVPTGGGMAWCAPSARIVAVDRARVAWSDDVHETVYQQLRGAYGPHAAAAWRAGLSVRDAVAIVQRHAPQSDPRAVAFLTWAGRADR